LNKEDEKDKAHFTDQATGADLEVIEKQSLLEWFANNYKKFGAVLEFVTNKSQEGSQFCKGFGGIGGLMRYKVDFAAIDNDDIQEAEDDIEDYF
jgi:peptide chain release factor subunit 1